MCVDKGDVRKSTHNIYICITDRSVAYDYTVPRRWRNVGQRRFAERKCILVGRPMLVPNKRLHYIQLVLVLLRNPQQVMGPGSRDTDREKVVDSFFSV